MSQRSHESTPRTHKPISKGNTAWRKVNKLAHRLRAKGVPACISDMIDCIPKLQPWIISTCFFAKGASLTEMNALAKSQSIEVLHLSLKQQRGMNVLKRKQTQVTEAAQKQTFGQIKQNLGEADTYQSARPQEAEAVFF